jgi:HlyD family secretion protein
MKKILTIFIVLVIVSSFVGTGFFLYQKSAEEPVVYQTDSLFVTSIVKKTVATGSITPKREIDLKSQVSGVVEKLYVEAGELVEEGQLIAKIRIIPNVVEVNNAEARVKNLRITFKNAEKELARQKRLYEQKVISEFEYNRFVLDFNIAKQDLDAALNNLELVKEGASKKANTVSNEVRSTAKGMVLDVPVKEGASVIERNTFSEGTIIATVADLNEMIFEGKVDESEVGKLKEDMDIELTIGALDTERFKATLQFISPKGQIEEGAIKFPIKAEVKLKENAFLRAGYSANADIVLDKRDNVLAIKESNLIFEEDKIFVEVQSAPQKFEKREISTGLSDGINIEVLKGLEKTDLVKKI